jgi:hypothetical protein
MKNSIKYIAIFTVFVSFFMFSCKEKEQQDDAQKESAGRVNTLSVIIDKKLWEGEVGDSIRQYFAAPVDGLPQQEPLFTLKQYNTELFSGFIKSTRIALIVQRSEKPFFEIRENEFARPQTTIHVQAPTVSEILDLFEKNHLNMISAFKKQELAETFRRIQKAPLDLTRVERKFGISLKVPDAYKFIIEKENFIWLRKETQSGNNSLLIYEWPLEDWSNDTVSVVQNIIKMRDSIGKQYIEGVLPNTFMTTEEAYAPYFFEIRLNGKPTYETKGTWELKNDFMGGPFINYAIRDEANNRYLVLEGFCYNPSSSKRDLMHELEAIIKSVKFKS